MVRVRIHDRQRLDAIDLYYSYLPARFLARGRWKTGLSHNVWLISSLAVRPRFVVDLNRGFSSLDLQV